MVKHTPGPFAVHPYQSWVICTQLDDDGKPCPVAALAWPTKYRSEKETRANGLLFAAAPDMLDMLVAVEATGLLEHGGLADSIRTLIAQAGGQA